MLKLLVKSSKLLSYYHVDILINPQMSETFTRGHLMLYKH